jgi:CheY-like chemotaxis protein
MPALYLTKDLFFASRVTATARSLGAELQVVGSVEELLQKAAEQPVSLMLLDLDSPGADAAALIAGLRAQATDPPPVIAFGSHIHEARLAAARQAGCNQVLTRGQFDRQMATLLREHLST